MTNPEKHIALVCNPTRFNEKALDLANNVELLLTGMGLRHSLFTSAWPDAIPAGITETWIFGGDGTVNWFINQYPDMLLPLSIFPGGSGNDIRWMLYGDKPIEEQVEHVLEASPQMVDAGSCNGKLFLNGVGIGFDGAVVRDLLGKKKIAGKASYLLSVMKHIVGYHEKPCVLEMPSGKISQPCFMISVANGKRYGGGFQVTPKASMSDGLLDINIVGKISPLRRIKYLPIIERGEHLDLEFIQYKKEPRVTVTSPVKLHAHLDGEYMYESVYEIEILPKRFSFLF